MTNSAAAFEAARDQLVTRLIDAVRDDPRLAALWLQGSLADGSADPLSDVDAYLAVQDAAFDAVYQERLSFVERLGEVLAWSDATTPGLRAVHALLAGPVKLDLFFEPHSAIGNQPRPAVRVLVDKADVAATLNLGWQPPRETLARTLAIIIRMTRQGAAWPLRLLYRRRWSAFAMMELDLINAQLAQLMAVQQDAAAFYTNPFTLSRHLSLAQRTELDELTDSALAALGRRDLLALRDIHLCVFDALVREGRAACAAFGIPYPQSEAGDRAIREMVLRQWPERDEAKS